MSTKRTLVDIMATILWGKKVRYTQLTELCEFLNDYHTDKDFAQDFLEFCLITLLKRRDQLANQGL